MAWTLADPQYRELREITEAERECLAAIDFALSGDPAEYDEASDAVTFKVQVTSAA